MRKQIKNKSQQKLKNIDSCFDNADYCVFFDLQLHHKNAFDRKPYHHAFVFRVLFARTKVDGSKKGMIFIFS